MNSSEPFNITAPLVTGGEDIKIKGFMRNQAIFILICIVVAALVLFAVIYGIISYRKHRAPFQQVTPINATQTKPPCIIIVDTEDIEMGPQEFQKLCQ
jgi:heme/copper-type cytochrome/quinol oxidase subunit 2